MASKQAREAYPLTEGAGVSDRVIAWHERAAFDRGAVTALREAAERADSAGHHTGGQAAIQCFELAEKFRRMADDWEWEASGE